MDTIHQQWNIAFNVHFCWDMTRFIFIKCSDKYTVVVVHDLAHGTSFQKVPPSPRLESICSAPRRFAHSMLHLHVFRDKHVVGCQLKLSCLYLKQLDSYNIRHLTVLASLFTKYSSFISHVEDAGKYALAWKGIHIFWLQTLQIPLLT